MTYVKTTPPGLHTTDAEFRVWATALHDALIAAGLVQTTDTGQVDLTTAVKPGTSAYAGYRVYRFADTLQATAAVFVKIEFGTGTTATHAAIRVQVGTATNGAGTLAGRFTTAVALLPGIVGPSIVDQHVATGLDKSYLALFWHIKQDTAQWGGSVVIDRSRNADGTPNGDGLYVLTNTGTAAVAHAATMLPYTGALTAANGSPTCLISATYSSGVQGLEVSLFPSFCFTPKLQAPVKAVLSVWAADLPYASTVTVNHYGNAPYLSLGDRSKGAAWVASGSVATAVSLAFRAE